MSCEKKNCTKLTESGFDVADLINKYGEDVIEIIGMALDNGFSKEFVLQLLDQFGPAVVSFLLKVVKEKVKSVPAPKVGDGPLLNIEEALLKHLLERHLSRTAVAAGMPQADVDAAITGGNLQSILNWILTNAPAILNLIQEIIAVFTSIKA